MIYHNIKNENDIINKIHMVSIGCVINGIRILTTLFKFIKWFNKYRKTFYLSPTNDQNFFKLRRGLRERV